VETLKGYLYPKHRHQEGRPRYRPIPSSNRFAFTLVVYLHLCSAFDLVEKAEKESAKKARCLNTKNAIEIAHYLGLKVELICKLENSS
jgi:hypothetical protein